MCTITHKIMSEKLQNSNPGGLFNSQPQKENVMPEKNEQAKQVTTTAPAGKVAMPVNKNFDNKQEPNPKPTAEPAKRKVEPTVASSVPATETKIKNVVDIAKMSTPQLIRSAESKFILAMKGDGLSREEKREAEKEFAKETSFALQAFHNNPYLETVANNDKVAVINAIINVAQTGLTLNPVLKLGYLIPMDKKVQFWPSYMGKREIVMRTGLVKDAYARLVYAGDQFEIKYGTGGFIKHTPDPWSEKKQSDIKGGYWFCVLKDGTEKFGTMNQTEIEAIAKRSPSANASHSPWKTDWEQMALKTIFNRGFKEMPKSGISEDQLRALEISDRVEEDALKSWIKSVKTQQDTFDDDEPDDGTVEEAHIVD